MYHPPPDTTRTWDELFQALVEYKMKYGTVVVPENFVVDPILGQWVAFQRRNRANLEPDQRQKLESIGIQFVRPYKPRELRFKGEWDDMFSQLVEYIRVKTKGAWPKMIRGNPPLANWVRRQRDLRRERKLSDSKIEKLNELGMVWKTEMQEKFDNASKEEQWMMQYAQLKQFYEKHGHSKVPARYLKDMTLGEWVRTQRKMWKTNSLKPHRKALLDSLDFVYLATPETGYTSIKQEPSQKRKSSSSGGGGDSVLSSESTPNRKTSEASTGTPQKKAGSPDFSVSKQQSNNSNSQQNTNQQQQLLLPKSPPTNNNNVPPQEDDRQWDEMFQRLKASRLVFGSSSMAGRFRGDSEMAQWVAAQRHAFKRGVLARARQQKLESIQFVFHTPFNMSTAPATSPAGNSRKSPSATSSLANDTGASELSESDYESASQSMRSQEKSSKALNKTLSNLMKGTRTWRDNFDLLVAYKQEYGDCNVPIRFEPDQRLGEWVHYVRLQMHGLSDEQRAMLDAIGFDFDHLEEDRIWNKSFHKLKEYQANGNFLLRPEDFTHVDNKFKDWVEEQRKCYKAGELPGKRLAKLNSICFFWETEGYNHNYPAPATNNHMGSSQNVTQTPSNSHYNAKMPGNSYSHQITHSDFSNNYNNAQMFNTNYSNHLHGTNTNNSQMISSNVPQNSVNQKNPHQGAGYQGPERNGWIQFYLSLVDFKNIFGHTEVPYDEDPQLYQWAAFQKMRKSYLLDHERKLLEDIGFRFHGDPAPAPTPARAPAPAPTPAPPKQPAKSGTEGSSALLAAAMAWDPKTSPKRTPKWLSPRHKTKRAKIK